MRASHVIVIAGLLSAIASAETAAQNNGRRGASPPATPRTYDPNYEPRSDPNNAAFDPAYNPATDPEHPLKDPSRDPGHAWDRPFANGTPPPKQFEGDWPWGEMVYGRSYPTSLVVTNNCDTAQSVSIFVDNLPYITLPSTLTIPGKSERTIDAKIVAPPEPPPPLMAGAPGQPGWGWVNPAPPGWQPKTLAEAEMVNNFHQPNFVDVKGEVVVWHPWVGLCLPKRETYTAAGHIHFGPPPPPSGSGGPEKIAAPDRCQVLWNTGQAPPPLTGASGAKPIEDCTDRIRALASGYVERVVGPHARRARDAWSWLPDAARIVHMSIDELLVMKVRADAQMENGR